MIHWLNHIWNDPLSMKEQIKVGLIFAGIIILVGWFIEVIYLRAKGRDL